MPQWADFSPSDCRRLNAAYWGVPIAGGLVAGMLALSVRDSGGGVALLVAISVLGVTALLRVKIFLWLASVVVSDGGRLQVHMMKQCGQLGLTKSRLDVVEALMGLAFMQNDGMVRNEHVQRAMLAAASMTEDEVNEFRMTDAYRTGREIAMREQNSPEAQLIRESGLPSDRIDLLQARMLTISMSEGRQLSEKEMKAIAIELANANDIEVAAERGSVQYQSAADLARRMGIPLGR